MSRFCLFLTFFGTLFGHFLFAQESLLHTYDSLTGVDLKNEEKTILLDQFLKKNTSAQKDTLAVLYYKNARWNWSKKFKTKGLLYALKERVLRKELNSGDSEKKNLYNLGYMHSRLPQPDYESAIAYFDTLISISAGVEVRLGNVYRERGDIYDNTGDFQQALENYEQSERIFASPDRRNLLVKTYINMAATFVNTGDSIYLTPFLKTIKKINDLEPEAVSKAQRAKLLLNTGSMYNTTIQFQKALGPTREALNLFIDEADYENIVKSLSLIGVLNTKMDAFEEASLNFDQAVKYAGDDPFLNSYISNNRADLFLKKKDYKAAIYNYHKAIQSVLNLSDSHNNEVPDIKEIEISPFKKYILEYVMDLANCRLAFFETTQNINEIKKAEKLIRLADKILDQLYFESREELSKLYWRKKGSELYLQAVSICHILNKPDDALYFMEKNRGLLLLENITAAKARKYGKVPESIVQREHQLLDAIKVRERLLLTDRREKSNEEITRLKEDIFGLKNSYKNFIDSLELGYPEYHRYKKALQVITINEVRPSLGKQEYLINYILGEDLGFVLLISRDDVQLKKLNTSQVIKTRISKYLELIGKPLVSKNQQNDFEKLSKQLFQDVIPFNIHKMKGVIKLTIVPDGELQYLPFETLMPDQEYLLEKADIHYNYSLTLGYKSSLSVEKTNVSSAGFVLGNFKDNYVPSLLNAEKELNAMTPYFEKEILFNSAATKAHFLKAYNTHNLVHISTHGGVENGTPWLALFDGKLLFDELYFLSDTKKMVVLSACKTSKGEHKVGEGIYSLTRGFMNSGSQSVVSTLWEANEKSSTEILFEFYAQIEKGKTKSEALRNSKLKYLNLHKNTSAASPYYWGSIIITGNNDPLYETPFWYYFLALFVLIGIILFWLGFSSDIKKRKRG